MAWVCRQYQLSCQELFADQKQSARKPKTGAEYQFEFTSLISQKENTKFHTHVK